MLQHMNDGFVIRQAAVKGYNHRIRLLDVSGAFGASRYRDGGNNSDEAVIQPRTHRLALNTVS